MAAPVLPWSNHPDVDKIAFTGSTEVGRIIRTATAGSGKKLSLELGGKSPFIVFSDADLDSVVEGVVDAIWFNQGQVCCAGSRILVQEGVAERLVAKLKQRMETLRVGDPLDKAVDIGAIIAPVQLEKIQQLVRRGEEEGATLWQPSWSCPQDGWFFPPTLFTEVSPAATIAQVEIFGPVVVFMTFRTPVEAIELANNTRYGLAASVWTENINLALDVAPQLKAGTVWVNCTNVFDAASGFGGYRESGFGREGGREGLREYVKWTRGPTDKRTVGQSKRARRKLQTRAAQLERLLTAPQPLRLFPRSTVPRNFTSVANRLRPDSGYSLAISDFRGQRIGEVGQGNRKDIRNAVEAARKAAMGWARSTAHNRAQVLYYMAENLAARAGEFSARLAAASGESSSAEREVELTIERIYTYAAFADKYDGLVHHTPYRNVTLAMPEPLGVLGVVCPGSVAATRFRVDCAARCRYGKYCGRRPLVAGSSRSYRSLSSLETSDVPGGVINIVTGPGDELARVLAAHDDVDGLWYCGSAGGLRRRGASLSREHEAHVGGSGEAPRLV